VSGVVAGAMDDQRGTVSVMDDSAGDAPEQHRTDTRESSRTEDDRRRVMAVGRLDDRAPDRSGGLDGGRLGLQARLLRDADALAGDATAVLSGRSIDLDEVDHVGGRARPSNAAQEVSERLPHGHDQRTPADEQGRCGLNGVPGILRAVVAEEERAVGGISGVHAYR
jgi:hypothetical protein